MESKLVEILVQFSNLPGCLEAAVDVSVTSSENTEVLFSRLVGSLDDSTT